MCAGGSLPTRREFGLAFFLCVARLPRLSNTASKPRKLSRNSQQLSSAKTARNMNTDVQLTVDGTAVTASTRFVDNVPRVAVSALGDDGSGDSLPHTPLVLTGCCDRWPAWRGGSGESWSAERLAARLPAATQVRLDGGPGFARESLCNPFVTLQAYAQYASTTQDSASLYVFDDKVLTAPFGGGAAAEGRSADDLVDLVARAHARRRGRRATAPRRDLLPERLQMRRPLRPRRLSGGSHDVVTSAARLVTPQGSASPLSFLVGRRATLTVRAPRATQRRLPGGFVALMLSRVPQV